MKHRQRVLVVRFSSIGDIVLTTAVVRCLKKQLRGAEVHFLTKTQNEAVLTANPYIDKIWLYDRNFRDLIPQLKSQAFDFIIDLHNNYRSAYAKRQLKVPSAAFPKLNVRKWLAVNLKIKVLPDIHIVDRYFEAAAPLNVKNDGNGLDYFIPGIDVVDLSSLPEGYHHGYVAVVIGGKHNTKIFPPERVAAVCNKLSRPVILLGGKEDRERGAKIISQTETLVYNACGLYNLNQSASLIKQATAVLTNDTGLMHIAAAFNKPIVSVWGNTIPEFGMYPYMKNKETSNSMIAEVKGLSCRPCSKLGFKECPKQHFKCMNEIEINPIIQFLNHVG
jgi:ADP-heptose:LPS heptosyltransferase